MEDFYINITSQEESYDYSNITFNYSNITSNYSNINYNYYYFYDFCNNNYYDNTECIMYVVTCIIIGVGLPLTLVAIYALYSQVRNDHVAPIYVINLLITDLIQFCCLIAEVAPIKDWMIYSILFDIYIYCLMVSIGFMVCVALERYLVITCPLWYHFRRTIKISVVVCDFKTSLIIFGVFFLLPLPLFIFFLGGTLKVLSASRVPSDEKRRIVGVLVLVLLINTLLFLPTIIWFMADGPVINFTLYGLSVMFLRLSPLADLALYVFMRKGTIDKLLVSVCCCRMDSNDQQSISVNNDNI